MDDHNISYFRNLWQTNMLDLENLCKVWEKICSDNPIPDDVHGEIRTVIGLARLLMNQKLKQFEGLIDDAEFHTGEKEITCSDLEGFWDMVYFQVEKIEKSFERLDKCKNNEWKFVEEISEKPMKNKVPVKKDVTAISKKKELVKAQMLAARQRLAEAKKKMIAERKEGKDQNLIEILQPNKEGQSQSSVSSGRVMNTTSLTDKTIIKESNENEKQNLHVYKKAITPVKTRDSDEKSLNLNIALKQKEGQRKKHSASVCNKENIFMDDDSSDVKHISTKQTKSKESETQEPEKTRRRTKDFIKLQCVTRSAAKKAMVLQQNALQKS